MPAKQFFQHRLGATRLDWMFGLGIAFVALLIALRGIATMRTNSLQRETATRQKEIGGGILSNKWLKGEFRWGAQRRHGSSPASDLPAHDRNRASGFAINRSGFTPAIDAGEQAKAEPEKIPPAGARPSAEAINVRD